MFEVEFRTKTLVRKYGCNASKSVLSLVVLTFCQKYLFDLILELMCTLIFKTLSQNFNGNGNNLKNFKRVHSSFHR